MSSLLLYHDISTNFVRGGSRGKLRVLEHSLRPKLPKVLSVNLSAEALPFWRDLRNILPLQSRPLETNCDALRTSCDLPWRLQVHRPIRRKSGLSNKITARGVFVSTPLLSNLDPPLFVRMCTLLYACVLVYTRGIRRYTSAYPCVRVRTGMHASVTVFTHAYTVVRICVYACDTAVHAWFPYVRVCTSVYACATVFTQV